MDYTPEQLRKWADDPADIEPGSYLERKQNVVDQLRAHAAKIEECERYRKALIHQRTALQIVRDRQRGSVGIDDLNKGIALIDAALKETT